MHFALEEYFFHCLAFMPNNLHSPGMDLGKEKVLFNLLLSLTFFVRGLVFFSNSHTDYLGEVRF